MPDTSENSKHEPQQGGNTSDKASSGDGSSGEETFTPCVLFCLTSEGNDESSHKDDAPVAMKKEGGDPTMYGQEEDGEREVNPSQ